jgi:hypothetical protein
VIRRLDGGCCSIYRTQFYGVGLDLSDLREYQPLDDVRYIDWNVTARTDRLHVRGTWKTGEVTTWFLLDLSRSMRFGLSIATSKRADRSGGDPGLAFHTAAIQWPISMIRGHPRSPLGGRRQVLRDPRAPPGDRQPNPSIDRPGSAAQCWVEHPQAAVAGFLVSISSANQAGNGPWRCSAGSMGDRHPPVRSPVPVAGGGLIYLEDTETGEQLAVDTSDPGFSRTSLRQAGAAK